MLFAIENGLPYAIIDGKAYPVSIESGNVTIDKEHGATTSLMDTYTFREVTAKLGETVTSIKRTRKKKEEQ